LSDTTQDSRVQAVLKNGILPVNFYIGAGDFIAFLVSAANLKVSKYPHYET